MFIAQDFGSDSTFKLCVFNFWWQEGMTFGLHLHHRLGFSIIDVLMCMQYSSADWLLPNQVIRCIYRSATKLTLTTIDMKRLLNKITNTVNEQKRKKSVKTSGWQIGFKPFQWKLAISTCWNIYVKGIYHLVQWFYILYIGVKKWY